MKTVAQGVLACFRLVSTEYLLVLRLSSSNACSGTDAVLTVQVSPCQKSRCTDANQTLVTTGFTPRRATVMHPAERRQNSSL